MRIRTCLLWVVIGLRCGAESGRAETIISPEELGDWYDV